MSSNGNSSSSSSDSPQASAKEQVRPPKLMSRTLTLDEILPKLSRQLPLQVNGMPQGFYRMDLLPPEVEQEDLQDILDAAYVELQYHEGFPAFHDGRPFWHRLEYESTAAYELFRLYLQAGETGPRSLEDLMEDPTALTYIKAQLLNQGLAQGLSAREVEQLLQAPLNSADSENSNPNPNPNLNTPKQGSEDPPSAISGTDATVSQLSVSPHNAPRQGSSLGSGLDLMSDAGREHARLALIQWYHKFYWRERTRAYDLYRAAAAKHIKARRALSVEEDHYTLSSRLMTKLRNYLESPGFWEQISAKEAISLLKELTAMQRKATGLDDSRGVGRGAGPGKYGDEMDFELIMRSITSQGSRGSQVIDEDGRIVPSSDTMLRDVLSDPQSLRMMQELVIRVTTKHDEEVYQSSTGQRAREYDIPLEERLAAEGYTPEEIRAKLDQDKDSIRDEFGL